MIKKTREVNTRNDSGKPLTGSEARIYRILRLRPCTNREIVTVTGFPPSLVYDTIRGFLTAGLIVKMRHDRFFSRTNAVWRYQRPQRRYLAGIIVGSILVPVGVNVAYFLFAPGIILLGVFVSLFI